MESADKTISDRYQVLEPFRNHELVSHVCIKGQGNSAEINDIIYICWPMTIFVESRAVSIGQQLLLWYNVSYGYQISTSYFAHLYQDIYVYLLSAHF